MGRRLVPYAAILLIWQDNAHVPYGHSMRLVRYKTPERILPGMLDRRGGLRDLSYVLDDVTTEHFSPDDIDILYSIEPNTLPPVPGAPGLVAPIANVRAIYLNDALTSPLTIIGPDDPAPSVDGPVLAGAAHIVGAPGWSGARVLAVADAAAGWMALGPMISTIQAVVTDLPLVASNQGDIIFRGQEISANGGEITFVVDGLGQQRHACRSNP